ncbi:MAG: GntR family transcriptional regulator [Synergistaceae bacterium]|nr:GntR family transcriptional regulator [Synergistaceae bacterium]
MDTILLIMLELRKKYKSGSALEILQEAILSGDVPEGIILTQNELALSLGISRMPVREALIALEYQGLIERLPSQHVKVVRIDEEFIRSIFSDMGLIEIETLKSFTNEKIIMLSKCDTQADFHAAITKNIKSPFRRRMLETLTGIYLSFVLANSGNLEKINEVFRDLRASLRCDFEVIRAGYAVYDEVLASELIQIRKGKILHAQS